MNGTAKTKVVSCEIGDSGLDVGGKIFTDELLGMGTASTGGAVCGEPFDSELGNTKVNNAMLSAACNRDVRHSCALESLGHDSCV